MSLCNCSYVWLVLCQCGLFLVTMVCISICVSILFVDKACMSFIILNTAHSARLHNHHKNQTLDLFYSLQSEVSVQNSQLISAYYNRSKLPSYIATSTGPQCY